MSLLLKLLRDLRGSRRTPETGLYDIFRRSGDLHRWHHYLKVYESWLGPLRGRPITLLEIGLWKGGSLRMWREYFGASATIVGIDIDPAVAAYADEGFRIFVGDQADPAFLQGVRDSIGAFDVVIDDGGHYMSQQVNTFEALYSATSCLYIVEDTHTSYWPKFKDRPAGTFIDFAKEKVDLLHEWHWNPDSHAVHNVPPDRRPQEPSVSEFCATTRAVHFYDSLVVFEKGENEPRWHQFK